MSRKRESQTDNEVVTRVRHEKKLQEPKQYKVILHNDDFTTMEFVVRILMQIFGKKKAEATQLMLAVHNTGSCVAGVFPYEIAETKVVQVTAAAEKEQYPFLATMERD